MAIRLPPPPKNDDKDVRFDWLLRVKDAINSIATSLSWSSLNKTGSNLTDIETRNHNDLQNIQGGSSLERYHLTSSQVADITGINDAIQDELDLKAPLASPKFTGNVGIGNTSPSTMLHIGTDGVSQSGITMAQRISYYSENISFRSGNPAVVSLICGDNTGGLIFRSNNATGSDLRLAPDGNLLLGRGALGYGTGVGGTITQSTSKSTTVTLDKPCGQITCNNAALAAGTSVAFLVNNSFVAASDTIVVNLKSGAASNLSYIVSVVGIVSGGFYIAIRNQTAGSLSEALVLNFSIIKGVTS